MAAIDRVLKSTSATLSVTFYADELPVDADADVVVTATTASGLVLSDSIVANKPAGTAGFYTYILPPQESVAHVNVEWFGQFSGVNNRVTTQVEIVGARLFSLGEVRASDSSLADAVKYPVNKLEEARIETEEEFERICQTSFIPKYARRTIDGNGLDYLLTTDRPITKILSCTVDGMALTSDELLGMYGSDYGEVLRNATFPSGLRNVVIEYEYGMPYVPADVRRAALTRVRHRLHAQESGIPDRATSFTAAEGGTFTLATAGRKGTPTGIPDVDAVLNRWSYAVPGVA